MKVVTFGSKILDDAIIQTNNGIKNINRITNISPFSWTRNQTRNIDFIVDEAEYSQRMIAYDLGKKILDDTHDEMVLIDFVDARCQFDEIIFENGESCTLSFTNFTKEKNDSIFANYGEIKSINRENPLEWDEQRLEKEIVAFIEELKKQFPLDRMILIENRHILLEFDQKQYTQVVNGRVLDDYNQLYERCYCIARKYIKNIISFPHFLQLEKKQNHDMWSFPQEYYDYVSVCLTNIEAGKHDCVEAEHRFNVHYNLKNKEIWMNVTLENVLSKIKERTIRFCGLEDWQKVAFQTEIEKRGIKVFDGKDLEQEPLNKNQHVFILGKDVEDSVLTELCASGFVPNEDYFTVQHQPIYLEEFIGEYKDAWGNRVCSLSPINIKIYGIGNHIIVEKGESTKPIFIQVHSYNSIHIQEQFREFSLKQQNCRIICDYYSKVKIGKNGSLGTNLKIDAGNHGDIGIGSDCLISNDIKIKNTISDRCQWIGDYYMDSTIDIGDHVWLGLRSCVFSGARIGSNSVVGARSIIEQQFDEENQIIAGVGNRSQVISYGINWKHQLG